ncbi:hypothetical protein CATRI_11850 [Corynebacterium atrinae]|nr:hypothetical protein CATRI_11850 [Corynebacterium atrinae]
MHPAMSSFLSPEPRHEARQATAKRLREASLILGMAQHHVDWIREEVPDLTGRTLLFSRCVKVLELEAPQGPLTPEGIAHYVTAIPLLPVYLRDIKDPIKGGYEEFSSCAIEIDRGLRTILPWLSIP